MSSDPTKTGVKYIGNDTPFVDALYGSGLKFMPDQTRLVEPELAAKLTRHAEFVDDDTFDYVTATTNLTGGIELSAGGQPISVGGGCVNQELIETGLLANHETGFAIDTTVEDKQMVVQIAQDKTIRYSPVNDVFPGVFVSPKMVQQTDGSLKWSQHNLFTNTDYISAAAWVKTGLSVAAGATSNTGDASATTLTATSTAAHIGHAAPLLTVAAYVPYRSAQWICKAGTASVIYVDFFDSGSHKVYFDLTAGTVGGTDAGITASISTVDSVGNSLPAGFYRITAGYKAAASGLTVRLGIADANASPAVTVGKTVVVETPHLHYGLIPLEYMRNNSAAAKYAPVYHPAYGMLLEIQFGVTSKWSDDLTNVIWTASNITPALTATGPDSEPCTTLTAAAANGTILQTTADPYAAQTFSAFIKRRTGTGAVYMTADGGTTWTDVSSSLVSGKYARVKVHGVASPTIGFKLATPGDSIDVSKAINVSKPWLTSPVAAYAASPICPGISAFAIPKSLLPYDDDLSLFVEWCRGDENSTYEVSHPFSLKDTAGTYYSRLVVNQVGKLSYNTYTGGVGNNHPFYSGAGANKKLACSVSLAADRQAISINGDPAVIFDNVSIPDWTSLAFRVAATGDQSQMYISRVLVVPTAVDVDALRTWKWDGSHPSIIDCRIVTPISSESGVTWQREPSIAVLSNNGNWADFAVVHMQKRTTGFMGETPARLVQRNFRFEKSTGILSVLTNTTVIATPSRFNEGLGHMQSPSIGRIPIGANAGKFLLIYTNLDSSQGTFTPDSRNIYQMIGDGNPNGWTPTAKILDSITATGELATVNAPGQEIIVLPPTHAVAPNRMVFLTYVNNGCYGVYSDDGGASWAVGNKYTNGTYSTNEPSIALAPNGNLIATHRTTVDGYRTWSISTDGGVTFVDQGVMDSFSEYKCAAGMAQIDPSGKLHDNGVVAISRPTTAGRYGFRIDKASGVGLKAYGTVYPWSAERASGYSALASIFGGSHLICASEAGIGQDRFSVQVCVIKI